MSSKTEDDAIIGPTPDHYRLSGEPGYFPAGSKDDDAVTVRIENATLYQIRPPRDDNDKDAPLAAGTLALMDPAAGTADDVALVAQCGDTLFYVMNDDAVTKRGDAEFVFMLPEECIVLDLTGCTDADVQHAERLLAARTKFHVEALLPADLPTDVVSKSLFKASQMVARLAVSGGKAGAAKIAEYGEKKKEEVTECQEVKVRKGSIALAKGTRAAAETTLNVATTVSDKISGALGGAAGSAAAAKEGDGAVKSAARNLLLASMISYAEIGSGASEAYECMVKEASAQATSYVAKKYGADAAELARHTTGAAANFGRTALTARRVVNVKKLVKSAAKQRLKEEVRSAVR